MVEFFDFEAGINIYARREDENGAYGHKEYYDHRDITGERVLFLFCNHLYYKDL